MHFRELRRNGGSPKTSVRGNTLRHWDKNHHGSSMRLHLQASGRTLRRHGARWRKVIGVRDTGASNFRDAEVVGMLCH